MNAKLKSPVQGISSVDVLESVINVFNSLFGELMMTRLVGGASEPLYQPMESAVLELASSSTNAPSEPEVCSDHNIIYFTQDYVASALHEVAHWCIAGVQRRQMLDYGYWYSPDGRSEAKQLEFELVEVKPQAMERIFAFAAGQEFRISADNLDMGGGASESFVRAVHEQTIRYCEGGLPERSKVFALALAKAFATSDPMHPENYQLDDLRQ